MDLRRTLTQSPAEPGDPRRGSATTPSSAQTPPLEIPFNRPYLTGREADYLADALRGGHWAGDGAFTRRCHALLEQAHAAPKVLLTTSCTHALELAALLLGIGPGDEVILPSFTFVSTANAFVLRGARPIFLDIRRDTLNLDESELTVRAHHRTRVIVPVHYAGIACEMDAIVATADRCGAAIVEDNAHGCFGTFKGRLLGTFGALSSLSFHETKNFACGEGGALVVNDSTLQDRAEIIREKGTNRSRFFRGQVDKYTWVDLGSSYLPSELLAALLYAQLEARESILARRRAIFERYHSGLADWAAAYGVQLPSIPPHCGPAYHLYYLLLPSPAARAALIDHLRRHGILAVFHYVPLHLSPMGQRFGGRLGQCPVSEAVSERLLRLPFYTGLTAAEHDRVIDTVRGFAPE